MIKILLYGLTGHIVINGKKFTPKAFMPGQGQNPTIKDRDLADLAPYVGANWSSRNGRISKFKAPEIWKVTDSRSLTGMHTQ